MTTQTPSSATPAPEDLLATNDAEFVAGFDKLYAQTWGEGAIPQKYKELSGVTLSVVTRCEACLTFHLRMAAKAGATGKEAIEAMRIGLLSGGSITIPTVRVGYKTLLELGLI
jgi:AhpD family alkylhydroperoxidase